MSDCWKSRNLKASCRASRLPLPLWHVCHLYCMLAACAQVNACGVRHWIALAIHRMVLNALISQIDDGENVDGGGDVPIVTVRACHRCRVRRTYMKQQQKKNEQILQFNNNFGSHASIRRAVMRNWLKNVSQFTSPHDFHSYRVCCALHSAKIWRSCSLMACRPSICTVYREIPLRFR